MVRRRVVALVALCALVAVAAVAVPRLRSKQPGGARGGDSSQLTSVRGPKRHPPPHRSISVGIVRCTFVEHGVQTPNYTNPQANLPYRKLVTEIRYPTLSGRPGAETTRAAPALTRRPYPLVVFAHGYDTTPDTYKALLDSWVRAGFVVAAPFFPDTSVAGVTAAHGIDTEGDDVNQPGDVAFVTRQLLAAEPRGSGCAVMRHLVRTTAVGLAGQSDGANTVAALAYDSAYRSLAAGLPIRAVEALSGSAFYGPGNTYGFATGYPPLLASESDTDTCNPPQQAVGLYTHIFDAADEQNGWFLELFKVAHLPPYIGSDPEAFAAVSSVTALFFKDELSGISPGAAFLAAGNSRPKVAELVHGAPPESLATDDLSFNIAGCHATH